MNAYDWNFDGFHNGTLAACFTGHRQLNGKYFNRENPSNEWSNLAWKLREIVEGLMIAGYNDYLVGGALGVDMVAGLVLCKLKEDRNNNGVRENFAREAYNNTRLGTPYIHLILPCIGYNNRWIYDRDKKDLARIEGMSHYKSNPVWVCHGDFHIGMLHKRNEYMVDYTNLVIAVWDGREKGGTWACLRYARSKHRDILIVNPYTLETRWDDTRRPNIL